MTYRYVLYLLFTSICRGISILIRIRTSLIRNVSTPVQNVVHFLTQCITFDLLSPYISWWKKKVKDPRRVSKSVTHRCFLHIRPKNVRIKHSEDSQFPLSHFPAKWHILKTRRIIFGYVDSHILMLFLLLISTP